MAGAMFGVIRFFITHFLKFGLRSPQSCLVARTGRPGDDDAMDSDGVRPADR
jgi:hypothetical protein